MTERFEPGCGAVVGHGDRCQPGWLCEPCAALAAEREQVENQIYDAAFAGRNLEELEQRIGTAIMLLDAINDCRFEKAVKWNVDNLETLRIAVREESNREFEAILEGPQAFQKYMSECCE